MKYEIDFNNNSVEEYYFDIYHSFEWSEINFCDGDIVRNIVNTINFENTIKKLRIFGAETDCGTYNDNNYLRIGYARINNYEFVKNGKFNSTKLKDALWEIAHPQI